MLICLVKVDYEKDLSCRVETLIAYFNKKPKLNGNNNQRAIKCIVPYTDMASSNPNGRDKKIN